MMLKTLNKKHILPIALAGLASLWIAEANATVAGPYVGGQIGWGKVELENTGFHNLKDDGLAGRAFGGWLLNKNFGLETGYTRFNDVTIARSIKLETYAIDLVGKGIIPLQHGFSVYGKLGVAYLNQSLNVKISKRGFNRAILASEHNYYPTFGLGVGYDITQNVLADISYSRIQRVGSSHEDDSLFSTDFVGFGLTYKF